MKVDKEASLGISKLSACATGLLKILVIKRLCFVLALLLFGIALTNPHTVKEVAGKEGENEGIALFFLLDHSGSMQEVVEATGLNGERVSLPKIDLLKEVTKRFILDHPNDLIGLMAFARGADVLSPLTLDQAALIAELDQLKIVSGETQDGTAIGYAIYKAAHLISAMDLYRKEHVEKNDSYLIRNSVIVLVTDGIQDPNRLDWGNPLRTIDPVVSAEFAKKQGIALYIINVDPQITTEAFAPMRHEMEKAALATRGQFYSMNGTTTLGQIYDDLAKVEKSRYLKPYMLQEKELFFPYFLALGMVLLACAILLETLIAREVP